jgi:hypothetical protein
MRRVQAEYRSAAITHQLTHWLIQIGAPSVLINMGLQIVADELEHAELCYGVFRRAGGTDLPAIARETLELARDGAELEHDVARVTVEFLCLADAAAVRVFQRLRARAKVPVARAALERMLRDETRHRDFGWQLLAWVLALSSAPSLRTSAAAALPHMIASLRAQYGGPDEPEPAVPFTPADLAWGLMPRGDYRAALTLCIERDLHPRFARLGIELQ